ncbi:MAG: choice-of-anchor Q domain-containing protein [Lysobacteraceae bacterium]
MLLLTISGLTQAQVCRVTESAAASGTDGSNWTSQAMALHSALGDANCTEIWVAAGLYKPVTPVDPGAVTDPERGISFVINRELALYGSFAGTETSRAERVLDPANASILSGDIDGNDLNPDGNSINESWNDIQGSNSYHVLHVDGTTGTPITAATVIDGFVVTGGLAEFDFGGGLLCSGNESGNACSPTLSNLRFSGNSAGQGGAIYINGGWSGTGNPQLSNVTFTGNHAGLGGAMYNQGRTSGTSSPTLVNVSFSGNSADLYGGAMYNNGFNSGTSSPSLSYVSFSGNSADDAGAAIYSRGPSGTSSPVLNSVILWGNTSGDGLQITNEAATTSISHSVVQGSGGSGGGWNTALGSDGGGNLDQNPFLGPMQDNGGFTPTMLPAWGGSARDAADTGNCPVLDQRGASRPFGPDRDIGAVEVAVDRSLGACLVDDTAAGPAPGDGSSWTTAYHGLQSALADTTCPEIWVAAGLYKPVTPVDPMAVSDVEREVSFRINGELRLYGGFAGSEASLAERVLDPASPSILSGDIDDNDLNSDGNFINEAASDIQGDNSFHVVLVDGSSGTAITTSTVIDGFIITGGLAPGDPNLLPNGGGLLCLGRGGGNACSPTLSNLDFRGNQSNQHGGAMFNDGSGGSSSPLLSDVSFSGNSAGIDGGAMYNGGWNSGTSSPTLSNVDFTANDAGRDGGALFNDGASGTSNPVLNNVHFTANDAVRDGGAMFNNGSDDGTSSPTLNSVNFSSNSASGGGAMYNTAFMNGISSPTLNNVSFSANSATAHGGAMFNRGYAGISSPVLSNVSFEDNDAGADGGAMFNLSVFRTNSPTLNSVRFSGNSATGVGGAMFNYANGSTGTISPTLTNVSFSDNSASHGGAMYNEGENSGASSPTLTNVTFSANSANVGGGAIYNMAHFGAVSSPTLSHVILWGNTANGVSNQIHNEMGYSSIRYSVVEGSGGSGGSWDTSLGSDGGGNLDLNPLLGPMQNNGGLTLTMLPATGSPAIDAGDPNLTNCPADDQRGVSRPQGMGCDIGAVEAAPMLTVIVNGQGLVSADTAPADFFGLILDCGEGSGDCVAEYPETSVVSLLLTPESGWIIDSVVGCTGSLAGNVYTTAAINADCTVIVTFVQPFTVTPAVSSGSGSISPDTPQIVNAGETQAFTLLPESGWDIGSVTGCGGSLAGDVYTTAAINADCTVTASFVVAQYTLSYTAGANGSLSGNTAQTVNHGGSGTAVTASPATGYHFVEWSDGITDNPRVDVNVTANISVTASFALDQAQYTVTPIIGSGQGSISPDDAQTVDHGATTVFTITPESGWAIDGVSGCSGSLVGDAYTTAPVLADCVVTVTFVELPTGNMIFANGFE